LKTRRTGQEQSLWYKDAVIYQLHVRTFFDSDGNGTGDFQGLIQKLDYILELGANTVWIMPFFRSPGDDDGYDVTDYRAVDPRYGNLNDFRNFVSAAHARGLRVIIELVLNHTSDDHPWFQRARRSEIGSTDRDYYVWSKNDDKFSQARVIFTDVENSNWTWDPIANAHYWHRFYEHQPDLNYNNPAVVQSMIEVMQYWIDQDIDGFRLDAVPYLIEREGTSSESLAETHRILKRIRKSVCERNPDIVLIAEANQPTEKVMEYFGDGDECHMAFHFPLMPQIFMAIAKGKGQPIISAVTRTLDIPDSCQWAIFLRNHDELSLEMVSDKDRQYLWSAYAPEEEARINLGIRRRLAPLMDNDRQRIELMHALLLSLPGSPVLYYGDEIGMGDNIALADRHGVRTPMQWTDEANGGFSSNAEDDLTLPVISDGAYGFRRVNVASQLDDAGSLLNWVRHALAVRSEHDCFGRGTCRILETNNESVISFIRDYAGDIVLCSFNLSSDQQAANIQLNPDLPAPSVLLGSGDLQTGGKGLLAATFAPYAYHWALIATES